MTIHIAVYRNDYSRLISNSNCSPNSLIQIASKIRNFFLKFHSYFKVNFFHLPEFHYARRTFSLDI